VSRTTFTEHHLVPEGRAMLACTCLIPDGWVKVPVPDENYDFENPSVFLPILVAMAPYGAVVFSIGARPAYGDGSVQDWAEYLGAQSNMQIERVQEARVNRMPCILVDATMPSDAGLMRSRNVFLEDGGRFFTLGTLAADAIWASVESDFNRLLGSFALDEVRGLTAAPLRLMTSEPSIDLTEMAQGTAVAEKPAPASAEPRVEEMAGPSAGEVVDPTERATQAADVALADDPSSLDPEHPTNARLRDNGIGLVPRIITISDTGKYAALGAAGVDSVFRVPFGWHVIDDGRRTLIFDPDGKIQINLDLRAATPDALIPGIAQSLARENPNAEFLTFDYQEFKCLEARNLEVNGVPHDQAYLARPSHREGLTLVCRVTADRENMQRALNTSEVILTSIQGPVPPDPEFAGQPEWWRDAVLLERADRLEEAEQKILQALDHIGAYSSVAHLYEERYARLVRAGQDDAALAARERAIHWLTIYASSATSGGEGAALSRERDQRIAALTGGTPPR
jgi:hypothetical protein